MSLPQPLLPILVLPSGLPALQMDTRHGGRRHVLCPYVGMMRACTNVADRLCTHACWPAHATKQRDRPCRSLSAPQVGLRGEGRARVSVICL